MNAEPGDLPRLRRLWDRHRTTPFPERGADAATQELALYESWLGTIVEETLAKGKVSAAHCGLLRARSEEGNQPLFRLASDLGEVGRAYAGRLLAIEDLVRRLAGP